MRGIVGFFKEYKLFGGALLGALAGLLATFLGYDTAAHWLLSLVVVAELMPLMAGMWHDFRSGKYGIDILAASAIITSLLLREYWAAIVIVLMLTGGESLEDYADRRASKELESLLTLAPQKAHVLRGRKEVDLRVAEVKVGDKIIIRPGEIVPVDAAILEGTADFNESSLTGESLPLSRTIGEQIMSGSINTDGLIVARAVRTANESQYEQIIKLVQSASSNQTPFVRLADRYSVPFTIISFVIAAAAWVISGDSLRFLEVLVVATPCPLILAAPIAVISGMSRAAKQGIIIKTGSALERLAAARTFAFDKTGTLTTGELTVATIKAQKGFTSDEILGIAASLEQHSNHVVAAAIVRAAKKRSLKLAKTKQVREISGKGVRGTVHAKEALVGRQTLLEEHGIAVSHKPPGGDKTAAYVAVNGTFAGVITLTDTLRQEATATIKQLERLGIKNFSMITGDGYQAAHHIAQQAGISDVTAEALPADKLKAIEQAQQPVAFVGDGVNDAPVLTASSVGIALGARGSTAASDAADIVIMQDNLERVSDGVAIAKRTFSIARQSIFIGIGLSVALMAVFATGKFKPIYGAAIQEVVDVVVIFNALRAHIGRK